MSPAADDAPASSDDASTPEYSFEGYEVVFSVKVALTPPSHPDKPPRPKPESR